MSHHVPRPRYSAEHKAQAKELGAPLFTLDIWYLGDHRTTCTGVLHGSEIEESIERIRKARPSHFCVYEGAEIPSSKCPVCIAKEKEIAK